MPHLKQASEAKRQDVELKSQRRRNFFSMIEGLTDNYESKGGMACSGT